MVVFSCYWRPGTTLGEYEAFLGDLDQAIRSMGEVRLVVGGDFNAWNVEWGSRCNNPRGELLADLVASLSLTLANTGDTPTFVRGEATSVIDVTFSKGVEIHGWTVLDEINLSDHAYVTFSIDSLPVDPHPGWPQAAAAGRVNPGWALKKFNIEAFYNNARRLSLPRTRFGANEALHAAEELDKYIADACDASMPLRTPCPRSRKPVFWWNDHIAELRVKTLSLRMAYHSALRRLGNDGAATARAVFSTARKDLRREIRRAKEQSWKELCNQVESDPWGRPYKLIMRKFGDVSTRLASKSRELAISDHLFPEAPVINWDLMPRPEVRNIFEPFDPNSDDLVFDTIIPEFRVNDLLKATKKMSSGKAGGPSGIPNEIFKRIIHARPSSTLNVYNKCLTSLTFPACWKKASLVLLHKGPGKPVEAPSSFRPICLLDTPGKVLERLLLQRLDEHLDSRYAGRAPNQFGFRRGISTESAVEVVTNLAKFAAEGNHRQVELCVLVTLDVKNAFNSLRWPVIDEALREKDTPEYLVRMIRSWLSDRELLVGENRVPKAVTCGVPQGSVLGPTI
uniref:Retrovirus-related Pol polyprotein from type-1 retrotransposable element R1 n=1 Tax=Schizaphis graminum TaxID=13262 RepID=A0A2S2PKY3_SCHGA